MQNNPTNLATFLYIDTAGEKAMVALSKDNVLLAIESNETTNSHASFVQVAIDKMIIITEVTIALNVKKETQL